MNERFVPIGCGLMNPDSITPTDTNLGSSRIVIVMPVYEERDNIDPLIESFASVREQIPNYLIELCFVDDNSPDGTGDAIDNWSKRFEWVSLVRRDRKTGLGDAYLSGFEHVIKHFNPEFIGQMDSDLSHDPRTLIEMVKHLENGSDVVIGSRYAAGGGIEGWPLSRRIISRGGNTFARFVGGISGVRDCTSGFRLIKTDNLKRCLSNGLIQTSGYSFLIHLLYSLISIGSNVTEAPIVFKERVNGQSKLGNGDIREFITSVSRLRFSKGR